MAKWARTRVDEILSAEPQSVLPPEAAKRISAIADRVVAAQGG